MLCLQLLFIKSLLQSIKTIINIDFKVLSAAIKNQNESCDTKSLFNYYRYFRAKYDNYMHTINFSEIKEKKFDKNVTLPALQ